MKQVQLLLMTFLTGCSSFFYYPDSKVYYRPEQFNTNAEHFIIESSDGIKINGMLLKTKTKKPKGLVVQFHGNAQNMSAHMIGLIWLTDLGYDLLVFDYRGYGDSEGYPTPEGLNHDAIAALKKAKELQLVRRSPKLIVYGQSLGGAVLMRALEDTGVKGVDQLILESTFMSYRSVAINKLKNGIITYPLIPLAYLIVNDRYSPKLVPKVPVLIIHGTEDPVIGLQFGEEIYNNATAPKKFWKVPGGGHINTYFLEEGKYREKLINYLEK